MFVNYVRLLTLVCLSALATLIAQPAAAGPGQQNCRIMVHGDSLSAAYGLKREEGWVALLAQRVESNGHRCDIVNSSISGETTSGGLSRLPALLDKHRPTHLVLELGANDGLRGLDPVAMQTNLQQMVQLSRKAGAKVLLVGIRVPPNYGKTYQDKFDAVFVNVAKTQLLPRVTSLLDGFETDRAAFQPDGLHPVAGVQMRMLDNVWAQLQKML